MKALAPEQELTWESKLVDTNLLRQFSSLSVYLVVTWMRISRLKLFRLRLK